MKRPVLPLYTQILIGMLAGAAVGLTFGKTAAPIGEFGKVVIQLIKALATPLLFLAIVDAISRADIRLKSGGRMLGISAVNGLIAVAIGLGISNFLQPGKYLHLADPIKPGSTNVIPEVGKIEFIKVLTGYIPENIFAPFMANSVVGVIGLAILFGLAARRLSAGGKAEAEAASAVQNGAAALLRLNETAIHWVVKMVPFAVFAVVAKTLGENGLAPLKGLGVYLGVCLMGLFIQVTITYQLWIFLATKMTLGRFWRGIRDPLIYAAGASSSLATLPVTLKSLKAMGVSDKSSRLACCVGTNFNNDGILLYEAVAVLFVAQFHGIDLNLSQQLFIAFNCVLAGIGIAGIPEAGLISLALVLTTTGLPTEILPLLLSVDWILSRARAMTNVTSDAVVSLVLDAKSRG